MSDSQKNPWTTLSTRIVYQNPWMRLREDKVICPDGTPGTYGVMYTGSTAMAVVALTEEREIYLVGQYRYTIDRYSWEVIEGGAHEGEDLLDAAKRELLEEAGLSAERWEELGGEIHLSNSITAEVGKIYVAQGLSLGTSKPDSTEVLKVRKVPLAEAVRMCISGEITDSLSIIAILLLERKLLGK